MSTTVTESIGTRTRSRTKSDSESRPVETMKEDMARLSNPKRKTPRVIPSVTEEEIVVDSDGTPSSPLGQTSPSGCVSPVALQVLN